jgi:hypothetical protein
MLDAAREGRIEDVREYIRQGIDVNTNDEVFLLSFESIIPFLSLGTVRCTLQVLWALSILQCS